MCIFAEILFCRLCDKLCMASKYPYTKYSDAVCASFSSLLHTHSLIHIFVPLPFYSLSLFISRTPASFCCGSPSSLSSFRVFIFCRLYYCFSCYFEALSLPSKLIIIIIVIVCFGRSISVYDSGTTIESIRSVQNIGHYHCDL